ncbi:hypothetical protein HQ520_13020, partial [bacterium]|nr:hypothetical protein [bacterium]
MSIYDFKIQNPEEKLVEASRLLDVYGSLLTERQREFMRLHFEQDLSFSEIAREYDISRQAVHDSVKHAVQALQNLEEHLHLVQGEERGPQGAERHIGGRQLIERLAGLRDRVRGEADTTRYG